MIYTDDDGRLIIEFTDNDEIMVTPGRESEEVENLLMFIDNSDKRVTDEKQLVGLQVNELNIPVIFRFTGILDIDYMIENLEHIKKSMLELYEKYKDKAKEEKVE